MTTYLPMTVLSAALLFALGAAAYFTIRKWRRSRAPTPQTSPERVTDEWMVREAHNAVDQRASRKYGAHPGK